MTPETRILVQYRLDRAREASVEAQAFVAAVTVLIQQALAAPLP